MTGSGRPEYCYAEIRTVENNSTADLKKEAEGEEDVSTFGGAFISGKPVMEGSGAGPGRWALFLLSPFIFSFALASVYLGMKGVMRLGGFVATGGPYEIAHQAPDWVWIFPVSIMLIMASIFISLFTASRISGPNIMAFSWSALFILLGWNFVEFGFGIGMGGNLVPAWIICAVVFIAMGLIPLIIILRSFWRSICQRSKDNYGADTEMSPASGQLAWSKSLILQVALSVGGFWLGWVFFRDLS